MSKIDETYLTQEQRDAGWQSGIAGTTAWRWVSEPEERARIHQVRINPDHPQKWERRDAFGIEDTIVDWDGEYDTFAEAIAAFDKTESPAPAQPAGPSMRVAWGHNETKFNNEIERLEADGWELIPESLKPSERGLYGVFRRAVAEVRIYDGVTGADKPIDTFTISAQIGDEPTTATVNPHPDGGLHIDLHKPEPDGQMPPGLQRVEIDEKKHKELWPDVKIPDAWYDTVDDAAQQAEAMREQRVTLPNGDTATYTPRDEKEHLAEIANLNPQLTLAGVRRMQAAYKQAEQDDWEEFVKQASEDTE